MKSNQNVIIIGGGVIGLACAHYLAESGAHVRIIEKNNIGDGASHGNCGLLYFSDIKPLCSPGTVSHEILRTLKGTSPLYIKPTLNINRLMWLLKFASKCTSSHMLQSAKAKHVLLDYSLGLFKTLLKQDDMACDFEKKGVLTLFSETKNFEAYHTMNNFLVSFGLGGQKINKKELSDLDPAIHGNVAGAWLNKADWHIRPDKFMKSWRNHLIQKGVTMEEQCPVTNFKIKEDKITGVQTGKGFFDADSFILTTGARAPQILKKLRLNIPVEPGKGYSITMERPKTCPLHPCVLYEKNMVITPWKSGYRLGGTMEFSGYSDSLNQKRLSKLISGVAGYLKEPLGYPVTEEWTGLRPMTYDDMPIIDRAPAHKNLIIATGHGMLGLTLATGTGKVVKDLVFENTPEVDIAPFSIKRF